MEGEQHVRKQVTKLDKGLNLNVFEVVFNWRQVNGLKHDDYTRYRRFCARRLKRLRQKVQLVNKWEKKTYTQLELEPEHMKTAECLMIPLLLIERCWASANELQPVDEKDGRKEHHEKRRIRKAGKFCKMFISLSKGCNRRTQREITAYTSYIEGIMAFEDGKFTEAYNSYNKAMALIDFISKDMSEESKVIFRDITDDANAKMRLCKDEGAEEKELDVEKWMNVDGEAQLFSIPDDTMKETMKTYRESRNKSVEDRLHLIQKAVVYCNKMMSNKAIPNRMAYKELLDYAQDEKYKLGVEESVMEISAMERHLGALSLADKPEDANGKIDGVLMGYSKLIFMEKKRTNAKAWRLDAWDVYKTYYKCLSLYNQKKYKESYTHLRNLLDRIDDLLPMVEACERSRLEHTSETAHRLRVEILKYLWNEKTGDKPVMADACTAYLAYPAMEKKGWFSWW